MMELEALVHAKDLQGTQQYLEENLEPLHPTEGLRNPFCRSRTTERLSPEMFELLLNASISAGWTLGDLLLFINWNEEEEMNIAQHFCDERGMSVVKDCPKGKQFSVIMGVVYREDFIKRACTY